MQIDPFLISGSREEFDAIVVGSGISGGWAAKSLTEQGLKVLLVERGRPVQHGRDYVGEGKAPWELTHRGDVPFQQVEEEYPVQSKCYAFNDATRHFFVNDKAHPYQVAEGKRFDWIRGYHLGGRSLLWHRQSYRWGPLDFEANAQDGHGVDWPIRYGDVAPWYSEVEKFIGVSGQAEQLDILPDSEFLPPFEMTAVEKDAKKRLEAHYKDRIMTMGRAAHLSEPTQFFLDQQRYKCMARNECQRGCSFGAYFSTLSSTLPAALKTNRLKIACNSVVHHVLYDAKKNRVTGVQVVDAETLEAREYRARMVFLCASTLGTTQIMLNSTSEAFPNGLANSSGALGHYLMDHIYNARAYGKIDGFEEDYHRGRRPTGIMIPRYVNVNKKTEAFDRGFFLFGGAQRANWQRGVDSQDFGADFKKQMQQPGHWEVALIGSGEMLPRYENHVRLDPKRKDKWGVPELVIDCEFGENDLQMMETIADHAAEMLEVMGARDIDRVIDNRPPGLAIHEMGTARMGRDPNTSVLNAHNQAHDIPNLFVTDGACMSSSAWQNPSLTYMALTARAAHYAAAALKNKEI